MSDDADAIARLGAKVSAIETDLAHERKLSQMLLGIVINLYGAALEGSSAIGERDRRANALSLVHETEQQIRDILTMEKSRNGRSDSAP